MIRFILLFFIIVILNYQSLFSNTTNITTKIDQIEKNPNFIFTFNPGIIFYQETIGYYFSIEHLFKLNSIFKNFPHYITTGFNISLIQGSYSNISAINTQLGGVLGFNIPLNIFNIKILFYPEIIIGIGIYQLSKFNNFYQTYGFVLTPKLTLLFEVNKLLNIGFFTGLDTGYGYISNPIFLYFIGVNTILNFDINFKII